MITESASTTKTPPTIGSSSSVFVSTASAPSAPPRPSEPVSPMKTCAGKLLYQRKPMQQPSIAAAKTARSRRAESPRGPT